MFKIHVEVTQQPTNVKNIRFTKSANTKNQEESLQSEDYSKRNKCQKTEKMQNAIS